MLMYLTKYALTRGIIEVEAEQMPNGFWCTGARLSPGRHWFPAKYVHATREEANRHAEKMRVRRLRALQNELARLQALEFETPSATGQDRDK
jgi:hypothetical protein